MSFICLPTNASCNLVPGSDNFFTGSVEYDFFGYNVTEWVAASFVGIFGASALIHLILILWSRQYWMSYTILLGTVSEILGWSGRLWSALSVKWEPAAGGGWSSNKTAFLIQISTLIFAPAFLAAGNYILLGQIIPILGSRYARIHPTSYTMLFVFLDLIGLIVQAVGGGKASAAVTTDEANLGGYVMLAGVCVQLVAMTGYVLVLEDFLRRYRADKEVQGEQLDLFRRSSCKRNNDIGSSLAVSRAERSRSDDTLAASPKIGKPKAEISREVEISTSPTSAHNALVSSPGLATHRLVRNAKILLCMCALSTLLIFIRSIYRVIELAQGWEGATILNQMLFDALDGVLMAAVIVVWIVAHPGWGLPRPNSWRKGSWYHAHIESEGSEL